MKTINNFKSMYKDEISKDKIKIDRAFSIDTGDYKKDMDIFDKLCSDIYKKYDNLFLEYAASLEDISPVALDILNHTNGTINDYIF